MKINLNKCVTPEYGTYIKLSKLFLPPQGFSEMNRRFLGRNVEKKYELGNGR